MSRSTLRPAAEPAVGWGRATTRVVPASSTPVSKGPQRP